MPDYPEQRQLAQWLLELLQDKQLQQQMGMKAFDVVHANQGAQRRTLQAIAGVFNLRSGKITDADCVLLRDYLSR